MPAASLKATYTDVTCFSELSAVRPGPHQSLAAGEGVMPLHSERDSDFEARWAAWLARGAAHDRAVRLRLRFLLPGAAVVAAAVFAWLIR